ncbi:MAG: serine/threonine protein kinase [Anaerolineales bacterium]|nr:MAG: serine/threonine protein kinase [Anaerolineales bacterium]
MVLEAGAIIQNRYRIVKPLGEGGMGAVYRAWDLRLKVPVALKEMRPQPGLGTELLEGFRLQFQQEASVLARLIHPNLVRVTDYFEETELVFLVMDFVSGENLADIINREGAQSEPRVLGWAHQLLSALAYCHSQGVIHRDIKPQNIILKEDGSITLVDFGLVKLWDPNDPRTKTVMRGLGTPEYAPPEQYGASTDHTGPPSDLYSLGATLYHALSGQSPPTATERMAMPDQFVPLNQIAPDVTQRTEAVVMKALELSVSRRWQTAAEMDSALNVSRPLPVGAPPLPSPFAEPSGHASQAQSQPVRVGAPSGYTPTMASSIPVIPSAGAPTGAQAQAQKKKWPVALGVVGLLLCVIAGCLGVIIGYPVLQDMLASPTVPATTALPRTATSTLRPPTDISNQPTKTMTPLPTINSEGFSLTVNNESPLDVCYVFISPVDNDNWGDDWLDVEGVIAPGATMTFDVPAGAHDFLAETCGEATLVTGWDLVSDVSFTIGGSGLVPVTVYNNLDEEVCYLFISPASAEDWGADWLGDIESIPSGGVRVVFVSPDVYDFSVMNCDDQEIGYQYDQKMQDAFEWFIE